MVAAMVKLLSLSGRHIRPSKYRMWPGFDIYISAGLALDVNGGTRNI